ncbi:prepilin peptidase [Patescibacteria group bacterium]|nr:prepilin peptidase [Patescibacteria group bacterium]
MSLLIILILGLAIGSFLNVAIDRLPKNETIFKGRSHCDYCKKTLKWYDLVPVFSFIFLNGKCRYCKKKLSIQYPIVEIVTSLLFLFMYFYTITMFYQNPDVLYILLFNFLLVAFLIAIFTTDIKYGIIPDKILLALTVVLFTFKLVFMQQTFINNSLSGVGAFIFFLVLYFVTKEKGMGFGDVKFAFIIGFLVGFPNVITALYMAFLTGAFTSIILILLGKKRYSNAVPFGPFLSVSLFVVYLWGDKITNVLLKILGL